jgi:small-conductance mechanosensitive channel
MLLHRDFVSHSIEIWLHNPLWCFSTSVYFCGYFIITQSGYFWIHLHIIIIIIIIIIIYTGINEFCLRTWCFSLIDFRLTCITERINQEILPPAMEWRQDVPYTPVALDIVMNIYVVWAVGVLVSVLILYFERLFHKEQLRNKRNSTASVLWTPC